MAVLSPSPGLIDLPPSGPAIPHPCISRGRPATVLQHPPSPWWSPPSICCPSTYHPKSHDRPIPMTNPHHTIMSLICSLCPIHVGSNRSLLLGSGTLRSCSTVPTIRECLVGYIASPSAALYLSLISEDNHCAR